MIAIHRAELALEGLSLGDAFGQMFFGNVPDRASEIANRLIWENNQFED